MSEEASWKHSGSDTKIINCDEVNIVSFSSLAFLTEVDSSSHPVIMELIGKHVIGTKEAARLVKQPILQQQPNSIQVSHL